MDVDKSGALDHAEFRTGLRRFGMHLEEEEVRSLMKLLDSNGDGQLQFEEFEQIATAELSALADSNPLWKAETCMCSF